MKHTKRSAINDRAFGLILSYLEEGVSANEALRRTDISRGAFQRYTDADPERVARYARAKFMGLSHIADTLLEIQDEEPPLRAQGGDNPGDAKVDPGWVQWHRNRIDTRKRLLAKLNPKVYGDRGALEVSGPEGGPVKAEVLVDGLAGFR